MGIFNKACPQCTADNAAGAIRCACGFIFDTADANGAGPSPKETAEEEILFQEYLAARVSQAIEQATVAAHAADVEPANERRALLGALLVMFALLLFASSCMYFISNHMM